MKIEKYATHLIFLSVAFWVSWTQNDYQQALDYAAARNKPSADMATAISVKSQSSLYWTLEQLMELGISPFSLSLAINFLFLYFLQTFLKIVLENLGIEITNAIIMSLFMVFSYTFLSPFAYDVQVLGPVTQARLTPILVLALLITLTSYKNRYQQLKTLALLVVISSIHPVIGFFLLNFVILLVVKNKTNYLYLFFLLLLNASLILRGVKSGVDGDQIEINKFRTLYESQIYESNFCHHYTNVFNFFSESSLSTFLKNSSLFLLIFALSLYCLLRNSEPPKMLELIVLFYGYSLFTCIGLNIIIFLHEPISFTAFATMPMRFLDIANIFAFPILVYTINRFFSDEVIIPIICVLIVFRILNARIFDFKFKENELHFFVLFLVVGLYFYINQLHQSILSNIHVILRQANMKLLTFTIVFLFIFVQIHNHVNARTFDWKSYESLERIEDFEGSKLLTGPGVRFPMAIESNYQVLDHGELQGLIYVPEKFSYVEETLIKYYGTNLGNFYRGNSCRLLESADTKSLWETWESNKWRDLALQEGFRFVVVPLDWSLKLKLEFSHSDAHYKGIAIYRIY